MDTKRPPRPLEQWRRFFVPGSPTTKGSKSIGRHGQMYEDRGARLRDWMDVVAQYAMVNRGGLRIDWPCAIQLDFYLAGRDRDLDKLERAVWDALVDGGLLMDDKHIVESHARKIRPIPKDREGCEVYIYRVGQ
jgi:Holliday junction resolvase RusA-like endonuclease